MRVVVVVGTRPNFVKVSPILKEASRNGIDCVLVHTGQHFDTNMSDVFFRELSIPKPDYFLEAGGFTPSVQEKVIAQKFREVLFREKHDMVLIIGDVRSSRICAVTAHKARSRIAHLEAGLRCGDPFLPEEQNRKKIDEISDYFFVSEEAGAKNLIKEGHNKKNIFLVGGFLIDSLVANFSKITKTDTGFLPKSYTLMTLHRAGNVDNKKKLTGIVDIVNDLSEKYLPIVFPIHPRTAKRLSDFGMRFTDRVKILKPAGYLFFHKLLLDASLVITDSGGIQEEAAYLKIPCLTVRENTERPSTVTYGTNIIVGDDFRRVHKLVKNILPGKYGTFVKKGKPKYSDGNTSKRVIKHLLKIISG